MKNFRLSDREFGSQFCRLERSLLFDVEYSHFGFVHFLSSNTMVLEASRFTDIDRGRIYLLPDDLTSKVEEGQFVQVEPGRIEKAVFPSQTGRGRGFQGITRQVIEVAGIRMATPIINPPTLPMDEFIYRTSSNWKYAEEDLLDKVISLLFVSAPSSVYGHGGIGSEGIETMRVAGSGTPLDVSNTIFSQLPVEFRMMGSSPYRYSIFDSMKGYRQFERTRSEENAYSVIRKVKYQKTLKKVEIPIHLPFVLNHSEIKAKKDLIDLDVLEYQLTSLYTPAPGEKAVVEMGEKLSREAHREAIWDGFAATSIDPMASLRVAMALTRLSVGRQFDGKGYSKKSSRIDEGKKLFGELMKRGSEEIERKMRMEKVSSSVGSHPWREKLEPLDREVFFELRTRAEETGSLDFKMEEIDIEINPIELDDSLKRLNRYGYVLFMKGGTVIRLVIDSSPEDLS
jgi:hypothetical protein